VSGYHPAAIEDGSLEKVTFIFSVHRGAR